MDLHAVLAFACKHKALEVRFAPGLPPMIRIAGDAEPRRINVPAIGRKEFDALLERLLDESARQSLRFNGRCELPYDVKGLGIFNLRVVPEEVIAVPPPAPENAPAEAGMAGFFKRMLGG